MDEKNTKLRVVQICVFLTLGTFVSFSRLLFSDFINFDDEPHVTKNYHVYTGLNLENIKWAFSTGHAANWQPVTWISHMTDCQFFKLNPFYHHLTNLLLHIANVLLLFLILKAMTKATWRSAFVAGLFALHPLHVESVAWVAERKDVLSTFFCFLAIAAYLRYVNSKTIFSYSLALILFISGLMSKAMLVTFPFVLLLLDYWPLGRFENISSPSSRKIFYRLILEKIPFGFLAAVSSVITYNVQKAAGAVTDSSILPLSIRLSNAAISYSRYIYKMFVPDQLSIFYPYTPKLFPLYIVFWTVLVFAGISILFILANKHKYLFTGWFWYMGTLVPVIGLIQVGAQTHADRYTYIPFIGLFVILAWGANDLFNNFRYKTKILSAAAGMILVILAFCTVNQTKYWKNSITLFSHAINVTKNNCFAHANLAMNYSFEGNQQKAIEYYLKALEINPTYAIGISNLGCIYAENGQIDKAIELHKRAIAYKPTLALAHYNLATAYGKIGRHSEAMESYKKAIEYDPYLLEAHYGLGIAYANSAEYKQAAEEFQKALKINPGYSHAHFSLALVYKSLGSSDASISEYQDLKSSDPNLAGVLFSILKK